MPDHLHAMTIRQPTADDIVSGRRWLLPRPRRHSYLGRILIHSAAYKPSHPALGDEADTSGLPLGSIVGAASIQAWVPYVDGYQAFWEAWQAGAAFIDSHEGAVRFWPPAEPRNPERMWVDASDQWPDPVAGDWAVVFAFPAPSWARCPVCWAEPACEWCDGGRCEPIGPVRGNGNLVWRWRADNGRCRARA